MIPIRGVRIRHMSSDGFGEFHVEIFKTWPLSR